jgi:hypothetical protein
MNKNRRTRSFVLNISAEQHAALTRLSRERDTTIQALVASGITGITGVPDTMGRHRRHRGNANGG